MRKELLIVALGLFVGAMAAGRAAADVLAVPEGDSTPELKLPGKGTSMTDVEKKYGAPRAKQPTVGGDTPKHPPITRWDYDGFVVIFERDKVVDAVVPGAPPRVFNRDELRPAEAMAPPPMSPVPETMAPTEPAMPESQLPADSTMPVSEAPTSAPDATDATPDSSNVATPENPSPDRPAQ
jgi:hypothetical protein